MKLLQSYRNRLVNRDDAFYRQRVKSGSFGYQAVYEHLSDDVLKSHLSGAITLAIPAIDKNGFSKWCAWDDDLDDHTLAEIEELMLDLGLHLLREGKRSGRAGHLWLVFDEPVSAEKLHTFDKAIRTKAKVLDRSIEFFPKQAKARTLGSALRAPLGIHRKPGADLQRGWFEGPERELRAQLEWLSVQPLNSARKVSVIVSEFESVLDRQISRSGTRRRSTSGTFPQLDLIRLLKPRLVGNEWMTQCPICAAEGRDRSKDNLRISIDGDKFCCVQGGPGQVHKGRDIIRSISK